MLGNVVRDQMTQVLLLELTGKLTPELPTASIAALQGG